MAILTFGNFPVDMDDPAALDAYLPQDDGELIATTSTVITQEFYFPRPVVVDLNGSFNYSSPEALLASTWTGMRMWEGSARAHGPLVFELSGLPPVSFEVLLFGSYEDGLAYATQLNDVPLTVTSGNFSDNIYGGPSGDTLNSNGGDDRLQGLAGNDQLNGGPGADTMEGGPGDDGYTVENSGDRIVEAAGEGTDSVRSSVTYTLPDQVEQLTLTGSAAIDAAGNGLANRLTGNSGPNMLDGGAGVDELTGGAGNDSYVVDDPGDRVIELAGGGADTVTAGMSYILGDHIERLALNGTGDFDGTGNGLANWLVGNAGANVLDGGTGADTMEGGAGDDTYRVDNPGDRVVELEGGGTDRVQASISFRAGGHIERIEFTGTADIEGHGCAAADCVTGNDGDNRLEGLAGDDELAGGGGTDCLFGGSGEDSVEGGEGNDYLAGGTGDDTVLGGSGDDIVRGWVGNDWLDGGAGADRLRGGPGDDVLVFDANDRCADGGTGFDTLRLAGTGQDLDLTLLPDGRLLGIERIDLEGAGENTLTLQATDLVALSPTTDELWLDGDAGDELVLTGGGWVDAGVAAGYHTYTDAATGAVAHADIDLDVTVG